VDYNRESTARQYALVEKACPLGWVGISQKNHTIVYLQSQAEHHRERECRHKKKTDTADCTAAFDSRSRFLLPRFRLAHANDNLLNSGGLRRG
jgi:hypothetical protein